MSGTTFCFTRARYTLPRWCYAPVLALALLAAGCTTVPTATETQLHQARAYAGTALFSGRLSIRYEVNGTEQSSHGSFDWAQHQARTTVQLLSPLGQTVAVMTVTPDKATLTQANRGPKFAMDADTLIYDAIGWPMPINGLQNWLQGFSTDRNGKLFAVQPANDPVTITTPDGWQITYVSWENVSENDNTLRPKRIDLSRNTKEAGTVAIRIVIDEWKTS